MGTRNVTIIKKNGNVVCRQYGQWDGYPTTALASICKVIKNKKMLSALNSNAEKCVLSPSKDFDRNFWHECTIGAEQENTFDKICDIQCDGKHKHHYEFETEREWIEYLITLGFSVNDVMYYIFNTRDTGYHIVEVLATVGFGNEIVLCDCGLDKIDVWIEAVNIIDLDNRTIESDWRGKKRTWYFDKLPNEKQLKRYEED